MSGSLPIAIGIIVAAILIGGITGAIGYFVNRSRTEQRFARQLFAAATRMDRQITEAIAEKNAELERMSVELREERRLIANEILTLKQKQKHIGNRIMAANLEELKDIIEGKI